MLHFHWGSNTSAAPQLPALCHSSNTAQDLMVTLCRGKGLRNKQTSETAERAGNHRSEEAEYGDNEAADIVHQPLLCLSRKRDLLLQ